MLEFRKGDLMTAKTEAVLNTVNCVGVMGRGVALQFKHAYPANYKAYESACKRDEVALGGCLFSERGARQGRGTSSIFRLSSIGGTNHGYTISKQDFRHLVREIRDRGIRSIALPPLGSGLGGLPWSEVRARIEEAFRECEDLRVIVYEPHGDCSTQKLETRHPKILRMTKGRAVLVSLMHQYLGGLMDPFITLREVHKLMYFMQCAGEKLRLDYKAGYCGPYALNLRHVLQQMDGYMILGFGDGGDAPHKPIELLPGMIEEADAVLDKHEDTRARFLTIAELIEGFETPFGLELLSTVHWGAGADTVTLADVQKRTHAWSRNKKRFTPYYLRVACNTLQNGGRVATTSQTATGMSLFD